MYSNYKRLNLLVKIIFMSQIPEIDLGSSLLSIFILIGFIGTAFVFVRIAIIGINYIKINYLQEKDEEEKKSTKNNKGF